MTAALERPFYFIVVVWGERYRDYFLGYCLPSLLAPGNLPALSTRQPGKLLIATYRSDWEAMRAAPAFQAAARFVEPVFLEIPPQPAGKTAWAHMGIGHKIACELAFRDRAYGMILTPDCMVSDGTLAHAQELAAAGTHFILAAALRFGEEPFFAKLREMGALPAADWRATGAPLVLTGRQLAKAAVNAFHSETLSYEWDAPYFPPFFPGIPAAAWWRVPEADGIVLHCMAWLPMMIDYGAIEVHDFDDLENWTFDGDYVYANVADSSVVHVVTDSDDMFVASWTPMAEYARSLDSRSLFGRIGRGAMFRRGFYGPAFNQLKRDSFLRTVRWHSGPVDERWSAVERRSARALAAYVDLPGRTHGPLRAAWRAALFAIAATEWLRRLPRAIAFWNSLHRKRVAKALRGDPAALRWVFWTARKVLMEFAGRRITSPRPDVPGAP